MTDIRMPSLEELALQAGSAHQNFFNTLENRNAPSGELTALLQKYRTASENLILRDFGYALALKVEGHLWSAHSKANDHYRKQLKMLKDSGRNHAVEKRKLLKEYLEFIKTSQRFYRQIVHLLNQMHGGILAIQKEAQRWKHDIVKTAPLVVSSPERKREILRSCHETIIRLGDLSRYRATEIDDVPDWRYAVGYYSLATEVNPDSGMSHHQQAIIARAEGDHFRTLYHLYRAVSTRERPPAARDNLELEFKKVRSAWERGELINGRGSRDANPTVRALIAWFVRLHSKCYNDQDFNEHDELEGEVTSQLAIQLKERSLEGNLHKMVLMNISAEYFTSTLIVKNKDDFKKAYFFFLRLNVKTFFTLLQILQPELERLTEGSDREDVKALGGVRRPKLSDKITNVARRVIPAIRLYSVWFSRYWRLLNANVATTMTEVDVQELFKAYTNTLSLLASTFPVEELPNTSSEPSTKYDDYLLEEDADTIGFLPLLGEVKHTNWYHQGRLKQSWLDEGIERHHPNDEMLVRIRDILLDGLILVRDEEAPINLTGTRFFYCEAGLPSELLASPQEQPLTPPDLSVDLADIPRTSRSRNVTEDQASHGMAPSESNSVALSKDTAMNRMVDNLVGGEDGLDPLHEEDEHENLPPTPPEQTFEDTALLNGHSYGVTPVTERDVLNHMKDLSRRGTMSESLHVSTTTRTPGSPAIVQAPVLPSLPNQTSIWNPGHPTSNPGSPFLANQPGLVSRNSTTSLSGLNRGLHSRNPSLNSTPHTPYGRGYTPWSSSQVTLPITPGHSRPPGLGGLNQGPDHPMEYAKLYNDYSMNSSALFGRESSHWHSPGPVRNRGSAGHTPPNGQGG